MEFTHENCINEEMHPSSCTSSTESTPKLVLNASLCPQSSHTSVYYEENQLYSEVIEPFEKSFKSTPKASVLSPVEIHEAYTTSIDLPPISWHGYSSNPKILSATNTGRTILINGQWAYGRPFIKGGPLNGSYIFSQIHFHCPSEHEIDGKRFPLEMHVVHYKTSYLTQERAMEEKDGTVVLVYLFQVADVKRSVLSCITELGPKIKIKNEQVEMSIFPLDHFVKSFSSNYYIYWGSVSTEKNSYVLQWIINCSILYVTKQEVDDLLQIMDSGEELSRRPTLQMKPVNDAVFRVGEEDYTLPYAQISSCIALCNSCKHHGRCHSEVCRTHITEQYGCQTTTQEEEKRDFQSQTFCLKSSKTQTSVPSVIIVTPSQTSLCDNEKKKKKPCRKASKISSCPSVTLEIRGENEEESVILNRLCKMKNSICSVRGKSSSKSTKSDKSKNSSEKVQKNKKAKNDEEDCKSLKKLCLKKSGKTETKSCELKETKKKKCATDEESLSSCSKSSGCVDRKNVKKKKQKKNKSVDEDCCYDSGSSACEDSGDKKKKKGKKKKSKECKDFDSESCRSFTCDESKGKKKAKGKKTAKECEESDTGSCVSSGKDSKGKKKKKKKKSDNEGYKDSDSESCKSSICEDSESKKKRKKKGSSSEVCCLRLEDPNSQTMTIQTLIQQILFCDKPFDLDFDSKQDNRVSKKSIKKSSLSANSATEEIKSDNTSNILGCPDEIKTIFEKRRESTNQEPKSPPADCSINFLLAPSPMQNNPSCVLNTSESEVLDEGKVVEESKTKISEAIVNTALTSGLEVTEFKPMVNPKELCLQTEHVFRSQNKGSFSSCTSQEYNVTIIYNQNILQEFKGTFHPNILEFGSYEKLHLVPRYPEPDGISVHADDCIVKIETSDELYIRSKFILKNNNCTETVLSNVNNENIIKSEKLSKIEGKPEDQKMENNSVKSKALIRVECKDLEKFNKNYLANFRSKPVEINSEEEKTNSDNSGKEVKTLFYKRKKAVYFMYEKVEKDESTGKNFFVGSFRTKDEVKALSNGKKILQSIEPLLAMEKTLENNQQKNFFYLPDNYADFEDIAKVNTPTKQELKAQSSNKSNTPNEQSEKNKLITLHTYKPKNLALPSLVKESQNFSPQNSEVGIEPGAVSSTRSAKVPKPDVEKTEPPCSNAQESQVAFIIIPVEVNSISKVEVILVEHSDSVKHNEAKKEKEYIPCLDCYN